MSKAPKSPTNMLDRTAGRLADSLKSVASALWEEKSPKRVESLNNTDLAIGSTVVEAVGNPIYVDDVTDYAPYGISETGWYVFARVFAKGDTKVTEDTTVDGAAGSIITADAGYVDVAVKFDVAAESRTVTITWAEDQEDVFVFKATDLAVRNLDYRVTFYVYDIEPYATWEYALTTDTTFAADKYYYTKDTTTTARLPLRGWRETLHMYAIRRSIAL